MTLRALIRRYYKKLSKEQKIIGLIFAVFVSLLFLIWTIQYATLLISKHKTLPPPLLTREGQTIFIPKGSDLRKTLTLNTITSSKIPHLLSFVGIVEADPKHIINLFPPVTGRIDAILVNLGDQVQKGQPLVRLVSGEFASAKANLEKAESALLLAKNIFNRTQAVQAAGGNSLEDVQIASDQLNQAKAQWTQAQIQLKTLSEKNTEFLTLNAPIDGQITNLYYGEGSFINSASSFPILTLSNIDELWVTAYIPEHLVGLLSKDEPVTLTFPVIPHLQYQAKISFINAYLEPDTRRNKTRILVKNPNHVLQPNMFANIYISIPQPNLISIPLSAILMNDDIVSVFVEIKPWTFVRREIYLGLEDGDFVRVLSGLKPGERVVTAGGIFIND